MISQTVVASPYHETGWESSPPSLHQCQTFSGPPSNMRAKPTHVDLAITFQVWWGKTSMNIYQSRFFWWFLTWISKNPTRSKEFQSGRSLIANRPESSRIIIACKSLSYWGAQLPNQLSSDMCRALRRGSVGWSVLFPGLSMYWCCWTWGKAGPTMKNSGFVDMSSFHFHVCCETALFQNDSYIYINIYI